jgi:hypothetical protein
MVELEFLIKLHERAHGPGGAVTLRFKDSWPHPPALGDRVGFDDIVGALGHTVPVERIEWKSGGTATIELGNYRVDDLALALRVLDSWQPTSVK